VANDIGQRFAGDTPTDESNAQLYAFFEKFLK